MRKLKKLFFIVTAIFVLLPLSVSAGSVASTSEFINELGGNDHAFVNGDVIELKQDVVLDEALVIVDGKYHLDLNGYKITDNKSGFNGKAIIDIDSAELTIEDGNIFINNSVRGIWVNNGKLEIDNVNIDGEMNSLFLTRSNLKINSGNFRSTDSSAMYAFGSDIVIEDGDFEGYHDVLTVSTSTTTINNGIYKALGTDDSIGFVVDIGNLYINGGTFIGNKFGLEIHHNNESIVKLKGGTFKGLANEEASIAMWDYSAGIAMRLLDGRESTIDVTSLLAEGYEYIPDSRVTVVDYHGEYYSVTNKEVSVAEIPATVTNTLTHTKNNGASTFFKSQGYKTSLTADKGYVLPKEIVIKVDGVALTKGYIYNSDTGKLEVDKSVSIGNIEIIAEAILEDQKNEVKNPNTSDSLMVYVLTGILSLAGLVVSIILKKKHKKAKA